MTGLNISMLTICGIAELPAQQERDVTHVLSLIDPGMTEISAFQTYPRHERTTFLFHDIIQPEPNKIMPTRADVSAILAFGSGLMARASDANMHLLIHCHQGISRSTAAMLSILAQALPDEDENQLFARLRDIRSKAWPNSLITGLVDEALGRNGRLNAALHQHYAHQLIRHPELASLLEHTGRGTEVELGRQSLARTQNRSRRNAVV